MYNNISVSYHVCLTYVGFDFIVLLIQPSASCVCLQMVGWFLIINYDYYDYYSASSSCCCCCYSCSSSPPSPSSSMPHRRHQRHAKPCAIMRRTCVYIPRSIVQSLPRVTTMWQRHKFSFLASNLIAVPCHAMPCHVTLHATSSPCRRRRVSRDCAAQASNY